MSFDTTQDEILQQLVQAQAESFDRLERGGNFKWQGLFVDPMPTGSPEFFKTPEGRYLIDVIPFIVQTDMHCNKERGKWAYVLDFYEHQKIGPLEKRRFCYLKSKGQRCAICEDIDREKLKQNPNKALIDAYRPKRRTLYNVWSHLPTEDEAKGIKIWDCSYFIFEKEVTERAEIPLGGGFRVWMSPDVQHGRRVYFERKGKTQTNTEYIKHEFMERRAPIPAEIMQRAVSLETIIYYPTYEEVLADWKQVPIEGANAANPTTTYPTTAQPSYQPVQQPVPAETAFVQPQQTVKTGCEFGGVFGVDCDNTPYCKTCKQWDECSAEKLSKAVEQKMPLPTQQTQPVQQEQPQQTTESSSTPIARRRRK